MASVNDDDMKDLNPVPETRAEKKQRERNEAREAKRLKVQQHADATRAQAESMGLEVDGAEYDDEEEMERISEQVRRRRRVSPIFLSQAPSERVITQDEREEFLRNLSETFNWNQSAYMVGRSGAAFRELSKNDPFFGAMVQEAVQDFKESVFAETAHRAIRGVAKPVFSSQMGCQIGTIVEKSDRLLEFLLKGLDRRFKDGGGGSGGAIGGGHQAGVAIVPGVAKSDEEFAQSVALVEEQRSKEALPPRVLKRRDSTA